MDTKSFANTIGKGDGKTYGKGVSVGTTSPATDPTTVIATLDGTGTPSGNAKFPTKPAPAPNSPFVGNGAH